MDNLNRHKFVSDDLIYNAIHELNTKFNMELDPEHFFEMPTSDYCNAEVKDDKLTLIFPVVSSATYAEVFFDIDDTVIDVDSLKYNDSFKLEIQEYK